MITQRDIARKLGISQITVSRVLNNHPRVAPDMREKVLREIERSGYALNRNARNLVSKRKGALAVIFPKPRSMSSIYFLPALIGISSEVDRRHYGIQILSPDSAIGVEAAIDKVRNQVDGVIVFNLGLGNEVSDRSIVHLEKRELPFTCIQSFTDTPHPFVTVDNEHGGHLAAEHLTSLGHRRLALGGASLKGYENEQRFAGFSRGCAEAGISLDGAWATALAEHGPAELADLFLRTPQTERPTGIFCFSDRLARLLIFECAARGIRVPEDLSVVGFDDLRHYSLMCSPELTTVRQPLDDVGVAAVRQLLQENEEDAPAGVRVPPTLRVRETTARSGTISGTVPGE